MPRVRLPIEFLHAHSVGLGSIGRPHAFEERRVHVSSGDAYACATEREATPAGVVRFEAASARRQFPQTPVRAAGCSPRPMFQNWFARVEGPRGRFALRLATTRADGVCPRECPPVEIAAARR